jgi:hypothetical protein
MAAVPLLAAPALAGGRSGPPQPALFGAGSVADGIQAGFQAVAFDASGMADAALRFVGDGNITGKRGPWCVHYVNFIAEMTGHRPAPGGMTYAVAAMGPRTYPHRGAIAYNGAHAGIVLDVQGGEVTMVSGNDRFRRVGVSHFRVGQFAYVEPSFGGADATPRPVFYERRARSHGRYVGRGRRYAAI